MKLSNSTRHKLVNILQDHKSCVEQEDYREEGFGASVLQDLRQHGIEVSQTAEEIDSKASLLFELDQLIEKLEKGVDEI